tara:strand:+ start:530 stop:862 length:333 start_codon:yes stop_codon:yes gene_type:complete
MQNKNAVDTQSNTIINQQPAVRSPWVDSAVHISTAHCRAAWASNAPTLPRNYEELQLRSSVDQEFAQAAHGYQPIDSDEYWAMTVGTLDSMEEDERRMQEENDKFFSQFK